MKQMVQLGLWVTLSLFGFSQNLFSADDRPLSQLADFDKVRKFFGLSPTFDNLAGIENVKIAVLDNGFGAEIDQIQQYLPSTAELISSYSEEQLKTCNNGKKTQGLSPIDHGLRMAQIAWGTAGLSKMGPQFILLNANGYDNLKCAIQTAIEKKVDLILYSNTWECCGNFDGRGFINRLVNEATRSGIIWVNNAGNHGGRVLNSGIKIGANGYLQFGEKPALDSIRFQSTFDNTLVTITISWDDVAENAADGTDKDLDLFLYDPSGELIAQKTMRQVKGKSDLAENESAVSREVLTTKVRRFVGTDEFYRVRIKAHSNNFNDSDRVRVFISSDKPNYFDAELQKETAAIDFVDATEGQEIMVPADNPNVITVGDLQEWSSKGPTRDSLTVKPDFVLRTSEAAFTDGESLSGTSNAAAYFAGIAAVLKSQEPRLKRSDLLKFVQISPRSNTAPQQVSGEDMYRVHPDVLATVDYALQGRNITGLMRTRDNQYVIEISRFNKTLAEYFPEFDWRRNAAKDFDFYVAIRQEENNQKKVLQGYTRYKQLGQKSMVAIFPWDLLNEPMENFVEIRVSGNQPNYEADAYYPRLWKMPKLDDILRFYP